MHSYPKQLHFHSILLVFEKESGEKSVCDRTEVFKRLFSRSRPYERTTLTSNSASFDAKFSDSTDCSITANHECVRGVNAMVQHGSPVGQDSSYNRLVQTYIEVMHDPVVAPRTVLSLFSTQKHTIQSNARAAANIAGYSIIQNFHFCDPTGNRITNSLDLRRPQRFNIAKTFSELATNKDQHVRQTVQHHTPKLVD